MPLEGAIRRPILFYWTQPATYTDPRLIRLAIRQKT
jgi:hypothetical protein